MISPKGREEILNLLRSDLLNDWAETDRTLKNVVRMLLSQRPDLIKLYFLPGVWAQIIQLERKPAAAVILASLKGVVVAESGAPAVVNADQARFYLTTRIPGYMQMARDWCRAHPGACPKGWDREPPPLPVRLTAPGTTHADPD
ncbi:hypothetical protein [Acidihalobacter ferrooxydans]|uniref:Uncharacterized protein n=1 Tax=Acidihalobacter ferrooxydans TaxID=1765967 RepID=A0A1P8UJN3_9GAMM|nr:hypothetical protein [Acidihalobacter ferrooxydans]APZ44057.1 hypothetical protein BW247_13925 [Acidihalobacter ferrooxydans]